MNKLLATVLGLSLAAAVHATPVVDGGRIQLTYVDIVDPNPDLKMCACGLQSYSFVHDIRDNGYDRWSQFVLSGTLDLTLVDDVDSYEGETVRIRLEDVTVADGMEVDAGGYLFSIDPASMQTDGKLKVSLRAKTGDFWFRKSELTVQAEAIPEPSTIALLAVGLLGVGFAARRRKG